MQVIHRYDIPSALLRRENVCGRMAAAFAHTLPRELRSPVAFASPICFREPEVHMLWHPCTASWGSLHIMSSFVKPILKACIAGIRRFFLLDIGCMRYVRCPGATVLAVGPDTVVSEQNGLVQTSYVQSEDSVHVAWVILTDHGRTTRKGTSSHGQILLLWMHVARAFCAAVMRTEFCTRDGLCGSLFLLEWIMSGRWLNLVAYAEDLHTLFGKERFKRVHAVHEMHPYSRVTWDVAHRAGIETHTIQHATIVREKLWYFPTDDERRAGLQGPKVFVVYSQAIQELLAPYYTATRFLLGCGPRYKQWKHQAHQVAHMSTKTDVVFVGSLARWDIEVVLCGLQQVMQSTHVRHVVMRWHPASDFRWLQRWIVRRLEKNGMENSHRSLQEDISRAAVVIGMNSTVLEEALAVGVPIIVLHDERFLSFSAHRDNHIASRHLTWSMIEHHIRYSLARQEDMRLLGRRALGIKEPVASLLSHTI